MKNILITGANGLIGRIIAKHLGNDCYNVFGIDIAREGTPSQRFLRENNKDSLLLQEYPYKAFYKVDITEKYQFTEIINKIGKIDCVIHLAALSDNETVEEIKRANEDFFSSFELYGLLGRGQAGSAGGGSLIYN